MPSEDPLPDVRSVVSSRHGVSRIGNEKLPFVAPSTHNES